MKNCNCLNCKNDKSLFDWIRSKNPDKQVYFVHIVKNKKWLKYLPTGTFYDGMGEVYHTNSIPIFNSLNASIETGHAVGISFIWTNGVYEIQKIY